MQPDVVYYFESDGDLSIYTLRDKGQVGNYSGDCVVDIAAIDDYLSQLSHEVPADKHPDHPCSILQLQLLCPTRKLFVSFLRIANVCSNCICPSGC